MSDRRDPRGILTVGIGLLIAGNVALAMTIGLAGLVVGVGLSGAHMALTQGLFAKLIANTAPAELRATSFGLFHCATGVALVLASLGAGLLRDRDGSSATFLTSAAVATTGGVMLWILPGREATGGSPASPRKRPWRLRSHRPFAALWWRWLYGGERS